MENKKSNLIVYTAIFGNRDHLRDPQVFPQVDYVCFTDNPSLKSDIWKIKVLQDQGAPRRLAKIYKILPHDYFSEYEYSLWVDGSHLPSVNPWRLVDKFLSRSDIAAFSHQKRNCIYDEAKICIKKNMDDPQLIVAQVNKYQEEGYPRHHGLMTCTVLLRRHHNEPLKKAMTSWWQEITHFSVRDQLSFNYIMFKHGLHCAVIPGNVYRNPYFSFQRHVGEEWMDKEMLPFVQRYLYFAGRVLRENFR